MHKLSLIVAAATIAAIGASAAPAFAAPGTTVADGPAFCNTGNDEHQKQLAKEQLSTELQLSTKAGATIDDWNGCFKVMYTDASGHTSVTLYDPDSLRLVQTLS